MRRMLVILLMPISLFAGSFSEARLNNKAVHYAEKEQVDQALTHFTKALTSHESLSPDILENLGKFHLVNQDTEKAKTLFEQAESLAPTANQASPLYHLGNLALAAGDLDQAKTLFTQSLLIDPSDEDAKVNLEWVIQQQQNQSDAKKDEDDKEEQKDNKDQKEKDQSPKNGDDEDGKQDQKKDKDREKGDEDGQRSGEQESQAKDKDALDDLRKKQAEAQEKRRQQQQVLLNAVDAQEKNARKRYFELQNAEPVRVENDW